MLLSFVLAMIAAGDARAPPRTDADSKPPKADQAHGIARPHRRGARALVWIPRVILYIPRRTIELALSPIRLALWAYDRYQLGPLYYRVFFFDGRRFGLYPILRVTSGFGVSGGVRVLHRDLFRNRGRLDAQAQYGGTYGERVSLDFHSGWFARERMRLGGSVEYRLIPGDRFFGIGNADLVEDPPADLIDPLDDDVAVSTRFTHQYVSVGPVATFRFGSAFALSVSTTFAHRVFAPPRRAQGAPATTDVFDPLRLVGYETGVDNVYAQARLAVDTRRRRGDTAFTSSGWFGAAYGGYTIGLLGDLSRYGRFGFDVLRFIDLWGGNRVLVLRIVGEAVAGPMARIPFVDLPTIGGPYSLRGHARARFRDRIAGYGTAEYVYAIDHRLSAFLFIDTGRVWSGLDDLALRKFRLGYGGGIQLHSKTSYIARLQIASSLEGGVHVNLNLSPPDILRDPP